jgi:NAD(P)H-dependent flavin oxidoreductase YrpB (nitropropane dioxygenase family)
MGVGVSGWKLARAAAMSGKNGDTIGTLSGTGIEWVVAYYLKLGGQDALEIRDALKDFPDQEMADRVLNRYSPGSKTGIQVFKETHPRPLKELMVCATYAAIKLARK